MKCYYSGSDAIGTCKSCGRGLSLAFASEFPKGLACKGRCEEDTQALIELIEKNQKMSAASSSIVGAAPVYTAATGLFFVFMGAVFGYFLWNNERTQYGRYLAIGFVVYGLYFLLRAFRLWRLGMQKKG